MSRDTSHTIACLFVGAVIGFTLTCMGIAYGFINITGAPGCV